MINPISPCMLLIDIKNYPKVVFRILVARGGIDQRQGHHVKIYRYLTRRLSHHRASVVSNTTTHL